LNELWGETLNHQAEIEVEHMSHTIPTNALLLVADGHKAILLRNHGASGDVSLREEQRLEPKDLANEGPSGSRPEEQTPRQTDEATFAKQLAKTLFMMSQSGSFEALVLIADPQTLGQLRDAIHKTVSGRVVLTMAKDLTNHSVEDITQAVVKAALNRH